MINPDSNRIYLDVPFLGYLSEVGGSKAHHTRKMKNCISYRESLIDSSAGMFDDYENRVKTDRPSHWTNTDALTSDSTETKVENVETPTEGVSSDLTTDQTLSSNLSDTTTGQTQPSDTTTEQNTTTEQTQTQTQSSDPTTDETPLDTIEEQGTSTDHSDEVQKKE